MCLATVYTERAGEREEVMHDVAWLNPESGGLKLTTLLGESRLFQAQIKSIDLIGGSIVLEETTARSLPLADPAMRAPRSDAQMPGEEPSVS